MASRPISVRLTADDLTGVLDAAVRLLPLAGSLPVLIAPLPTGAEGSFALSSETREKQEGEASAAAAALSPLLRQADLPFKKVDSLLRGHVAAELAATLQAGGFDRCVLAPALPAHGRITRGGQQRLRDCYGGWRPVGPNLLAALRQRGIPASPAESRHSIAPPGVLVCDAETDADLRRIAAWARGLPGRTLFCGTAGLAGALAPEPPPRADRLAAPLLAIVGTDDPVTIRQVDALCDSGRPVQLRDGLGSPADLHRGLRAQVCVVAFPLPKGTERTLARQMIVGALDGLLAGPRPGSLFVTGGETLAAVVRRLRVDRITLAAEVIEGVPVGGIVGGPWDGVMLVAKSGAFGAPDLLCRIADLADPPSA